MARNPKSPEEIFEAFTRDYRSAFQDDLISIILYGSGARGEYVPKRSDINFLIVLTQQGMEQLDKALPHIPRWRKRRVSVPLFLTMEYIESALDTYPIEFMNMHSHHQIVFGKDVLEDIEFSPKDLRLQLERELRGKLLHLRQAFLRAGNNRPMLKAILSKSLPTFFSLFSALLYLKEGEKPKATAEVFQSTAELAGLDGSLFNRLMEIKKGKLKGSKAELRETAMNYIRQIKKLVEFVDNMKIKQE